MKLKGSLSVRLFAYLCGKKLQENKEKDARKSTCSRSKHVAVCKIVEDAVVTYHEGQRLTDMFTVTLVFTHLGGNANKPEKHNLNI